jgi:signal transduction histidine kinase
LAAIGLIAFVGVAQFLPAMIGGIFWRGATKAGAVAGLLAGFAVWAYALYLPSFGPDVVLSQGLLADGPFGLSWLRPQGLFGVERLDPLLHALMWSLMLNVTAFFLVSVLTFPGPVERLQGAAFVNVFDGPTEALAWRRGAVASEELLIMAQRILGDDVALDFFAAAAGAQGKAGYLPDPTPDFMAAFEGRLAGSVGTATAHAMVSQMAGRTMVSVEDLMAVANETAQIMEYSARLESQQGELTRTAGALREANEKLHELSLHKDSFLSQVSHELRTPMTSIRAFSEILAAGDLGPDQVARYGGIIHQEAGRLTRLLDDLLDLGVLENGAVQLNLSLASLHDIVDRALLAAASTRPERSFVIHRDPAMEQIFLRTDADRLTQVLINLISNARKYCAAEAPELRITVRQRAGRVTVDVIDNGRGIPQAAQALIFEKFARLSAETRAGGAGLGLAICREVMVNLGGGITYLPGQGGTAFRVTLPLRLEQKAA